MASKRAIQLLPLRASSTVLRTPCVTPQRFSGARSPVTRAAAIVKPQISVGKQQQRWHSRAPEDQKAAVYGFEDVQALVESPTDSTLLIDVREPHEYNANAIPTAHNIPVTSQPDALLLPPDEFEDRFGFAKPPLDKQMVFYCKAGVRSSAAAAIARQAGYEQVAEYRGSWLDWERKGGVGTKTGPGGDGKLKQGTAKGEPEAPEMSEKDEYGKDMYQDKMKRM